MLFRNTVLFLLGFIISGCATIVEGTDQSIAVNLSPEDATCGVYREGALLDTISKDHRFLNLSKSKHDLIIICEAPNHHDQTIEMESSASGWGVVGCFLIDLCITDYSTGALNKYPETITITLAPKSFASAGSRDDWYFGRQQVIKARWDDLIESKTTACQRSVNKADCQSRITEMEENKSEELMVLEQRRLGSDITSPATKSATIEARLTELKDLLDRRVITQEEYDAKRRQILSDL